MNRPQQKRDVFRKMVLDMAPDKMAADMYLDAWNMRTPHPILGQEGGRLETTVAYNNWFNISSNLGSKVADWLGKGAYWCIGYALDLDIDGFYVFYIDTSQAADNIILRYVGNNIDQVQAVLTTPYLDFNLQRRIDNHAAVLNGYLAWTDGAGTPKMFNVDDAMLSIGPFDNNSLANGGPDFFSLPYYTPLRELASDQYMLNLYAFSDGATALDNASGYGHVLDYKKVTINDGHQFCYQFVHYNGMTSALSPVSQIFFNNSFSVYPQIDDIRQLYNINLYFPNTVAGDDDIKNGNTGGEFNLIKMVTSIRYYARLNNNGVWFLVEEIVLPLTISLSFVRFICQHGNLSDEPTYFQLKIKDRNLLTGAAVAEDDQNFIFSNVPRDVRDLVFADSRLYAANFTDGYSVKELPISFTLERVTIDNTHQLDTTDEYLDVHQVFKQSSLVKLGLIFYDKYRRRSIVTNVKTIYIEKPLPEVVAYYNYDNISVNIRDQRHIAFLNKLPEDFNYRYSLREGSQVFHRPQLQIDNPAEFLEHMPAWAETMQVAVEEPSKYKTYLQTVARFYVYTKVDIEPTATKPLTLARDIIALPPNQELTTDRYTGICFLLAGEEGYIYQKGDKISVTMPAGIYDRPIAQPNGNYAYKYNQSGINPQNEVPFEFSTVLGRELEVTFQIGRMIFCEVGSIETDVKTAIIVSTNANGKTVYEFSPQHGGFRQPVWRPNILRNENDEQGIGLDFWDPKTGKAQWSYNFNNVLDTEIYTYAHFMKVEIYRYNTASTLFYECSPVIPIRKFVSAYNNVSAWPSYFSRLWGNSYYRSFLVKHRAGTTVIPTNFSIAIDPSVAYSEEPLKIRQVILKVHLESATLMTAYGLNQINTGWGQPNTTSNLKQEVYYPTDLAFSGVLRIGAQFNELNRFDPINRKSFPLEIGPIIKMVNTSNLASQGVGLLLLGRNLTVSVRLGEVQYKDTQGSGTVAVSDAVLGSSQVLQKSFGCQDSLTVVSINGKVIWLDRKRYALLRYDLNGITDLTEVYGARKWFRDRIDALHFRTDGEIHDDSYWAAGWDYPRNEYVLNSFSIGEPFENKVGEAIIFRDQDRNEGFVSFLEGSVYTGNYADGDLQANIMGHYFMSSQHRSFMLCQRNIYNHIGSGGVNSFVVGQSGLVDICAPVYAGISSNTPLVKTLYKFTHHECYLTPVFNAGQRVQWLGFMLSLDQNKVLEKVFQGYMKGAYLVTPYEFAFTGLEEGIPAMIDFSNGGLLMPSSQMVSFAKAGNMNNIEGQILTGIPSCRITQNNQVRGKQGTDENTNRSLDKIVSIQSQCLGVKIIFVPTRISLSQLEQGDLDYTKRIVIFALAQYASQKTLPL